MATNELLAALSPIVNAINATGLDPMYLLPVAAVLAGCLLVYALGFKNAPVPPPLHALDDDIDKKQPRKQKKPQPPLKKSNGHANGVAVAPKKSPAAAKKEPVKPLVKSTSEPPRQIKKVVEKKPRDDDFEDIDAGEWVQVSHKKERKQKETVEQKDTQSTPNTSKKAKKAKSTPNVAASAGDSISAVTSKDVKPEAAAPPSPPPKQPSPELPAEDPEDYTVAPTKHLSKKTLKSVQQHGKQRRISESDKQHQLPPLSPAADEPSSPTKPADKITAEIVASYDAADDKPAAKSKSKKKTKKATPVVDDEPFEVPPVPPQPTLPPVPKPAASPKPAPKAKPSPKPAAKKQQSSEKPAVVEAPPTPSPEPVKDIPAAKSSEPVSEGRC